MNGRVDNAVIATYQMGCNGPISLCLKLPNCYFGWRHSEQDVEHHVVFLLGSHRAPQSLCSNKRRRNPTESNPIFEFRLILLNLIDLVESHPILHKTIDRSHSFPTDHFVPKCCRRSEAEAFNTLQTGDFDFVLIISSGWCFFFLLC